MRTKPLFFFIPAFVLVAFAAGYFLGEVNTDRRARVPDDAHSSAERKVLYWYDPMMPAQRFDKPGKSPFMDMELLPRYADDKAEKDGVEISARQQQSLGIRTAKVTREVLDEQLEAFGTIATNERGMTIISVQAEGVIQKLYVNAPGAFIRKGDPLVSVWIPQWTASQQEYLAIRRFGDPALTSAARQRLNLQFMPESIIRTIERTGKPSTQLMVRAEYDGYVSKLSVREGQQVTPAQALFEMARPDPVWLIIDYPAAQAGLLTTGSKLRAETGSWPGQSFSGEVTELLPELDPLTRTLKARVAVSNPERLLKPGMFVHAILASSQPSEPVLVIPEEALIMTGTDNRVLITEGDGWFRPVSVSTGRTHNGLTEIRQGLQEGQQVVTSGQFLIDSEASLRSALPSTPQLSPDVAEKHYLTRGEVLSVTSDSVTVSHEAVKDLNWPPMTMTFSLPAPLQGKMKPGDHISFTFEMNDAGATLVSFTDDSAHTSQSVEGGHK